LSGSVDSSAATFLLPVRSLALVVEGRKFRRQMSRVIAGALRARETLEGEREPKTT
jgi:hypothetical protein